MPSLPGSCITLSCFEFVSFSPQSFTLFISSLFLYLSISLSFHLTLHLSLPLLFHLSSETISLFLVVDECLAKTWGWFWIVFVLFCPSCLFKYISTEQPFVLKLFHVSLYKKLLQWNESLEYIWTAVVCFLFHRLFSLLCFFFSLCV